MALALLSVTWLTSAYSVIKIESILFSAANYLGFVSSKNWGISVTQAVTKSSSGKGILYTLIAYVAWGVLPLYWKALKQVPATEILAHRILWSCVFVGGLIIWSRGLKDLRREISGGKDLLATVLGSLLISVNWLTYIWAVNNNQVIETSLGYYINPLFTVLLGMLVLRERIDRWQAISLLIGLAAVLIKTVTYGRVPWVALGLTFSFGLYSLIKKFYKLSPINGLAMETLFVTPLALAYLTFKQVEGTGSFGTAGVETTLLLLLAGVVTATPLLWFAQGAKLIPLSTVGFIQYLSPTIGLLLGIFVFKEPFTASDLVSFGLIWCAVALYSLSRKEFLDFIRLKSLSQSR